MLEFKIYTCVKCGKSFTKAVGGVIMGPKWLELETRPVCDECKWKGVQQIFKSRT